MRNTIMLVLALATASGCAGAPKPVRQQSQAVKPPPTPPTCDEWECGTNGTRTAGTADETAPRVDSVTVIRVSP